MEQSHHALIDGHIIVEINQLHINVILSLTEQSIKPIITRPLLGNHFKQMYDIKSSKT